MIVQYVTFFRKHSSIQDFEAALNCRIAAYAPAYGRVTEMFLHERGSTVVAELHFTGGEPASQSAKIYGLKENVDQLAEDLNESLNPMVATIQPGQSFLVRTVCLAEGQRAFAVVVATAEQSGVEHSDSGKNEQKKKPNKRNPSRPNSGPEK